MKKIYLLALAAMIFAACTQENTEIAADSAGDPSGDHVALTRAVVPALTQVGGNYDYQSRYAMCLDPEGYLCGMYIKGNWHVFDSTVPYGYRVQYAFPDIPFEISKLYRLVRSACVSANQANYFITHENRLVKVTTYNIESSWSVRWVGDHFQGVDFNYLDLSSSFPSDAVFLSLTAADNGNVFVTTGSGSDGGYGATFPDHTVYRIAAGGNVTEIATVNAPVAAIQLSDWSGDRSEGELPGIDHLEYPNILLKAGGALLYGLSSNGNCYKITATTGAVEYFTPRVPVKCLAGSLNGNNPYALSGNTIVELRPNLAKDIEVGTIPADIAQQVYTLLVNTDATVFYVGVYPELGYAAKAYKFTR